MQKRAEIASKGTEVRYIDRAVKSIQTHMEDTHLLTPYKMGQLNLAHRSVMNYSSYSQVKNLISSSTPTYKIS